MAYTNEETLELVKKIKSETDQEKKNILIEKLLEDNIGLIKNAAFKAKKDNVDYEDLVQEAYLAFIKSIENFDLTKKVKFQTFAYTVIQSKLKRYINEYEKSISIPEYISNTLNKIMDTESLLENKLGRKPKEEEVAKELSMDIEELHELKHYAIHVSQLELDIDNDHDHDKPLKDYVISKEKNPEEETISLEDIETLEYSMNDILSDMEKDIVEMYYGINNKEKATTSEIGAKYSISQEKTRQIIKLSIKKLRKAMEDENEN